MKTALAVLAVAALLGGCGVDGDDGVGVSRAALDPPTCTNGDCYGPPVCTNGDCGPPSCTNGDCGDLTDCCCIGPNTPGTTRVCCCPSPTLDGMTCRLSLVLDTPPPEFHQTLAQETLSGTRPKGCDVLMTKICNPPEEEVCTKKKGKKVCVKVVKGVCKLLDQICAYKYCGPSWFPFDEPAPDLPTCAWWNKIHDCAND
jgi:hypothetical protein